MAIPLVIGGGIWAYRAYQVYRAAQALARAAQAAKALEAVITAQNAAKAEEEAKEKAKTDAQAKADAAADCKGGNCDPDPNCEKWLEKAKKALYGVKKPKGIGGVGGGDKGLVQMICEWINGKEPNGGGHGKSVEQKVTSFNNQMEKLKNQKHRCPDTKDLEAEAEPILDQANNKADLPHTPDPDHYQQHCYDKSMAIAKRFMGGV